MGPPRRSRPVKPSRHRTALADGIPGVNPWDAGRYTNSEADEAGLWRAEARGEQAEFDAEMRRDER